MERRLGPCPQSRAGKNFPQKQKPESEPRRGTLLCLADVGRHGGDGFVATEISQLRRRSPTRNPLAAAERGEPSCSGGGLAGEADEGGREGGS